MQKVGMGSSSSGAGLVGVVVSSSESSTPKLKSKQRTPKSAPRKKSSSQKALMGHKWFKGSPKSRSNQRISKKLLKSPSVEKTVQKPPTPVGVVEFDFEGSFDWVSVFDLLPCTEMDEDAVDGTPDTPYVSKGNEDALNSLSLTPGEKMGKNSKLGKSKDTPKGRGGSKSKNKTPSRLSNKNKNKSTLDLESRRKSPPLCKLPEAFYEKIKNFDISYAPPLPVGYIRYMEIPQEELADEVEYDLDEEDNAWLHFVNDKRKEQNLPPVKYADMELLMDRLEKESYFQMQSTGIDQGALIDDDAVCCICMDGECQNSNAILFCDMCNLAVHQECYGVPYIPEGQWLCRRCLQSPSRAVDCALCPNKGGAFKQTDDGRWAHVVCAIWIPEVCFANTVFLEPIDSIGNIPAARWRLVCFICKQKGVGACIQCHKSNCYIAFHVTCAQQAGLCMTMDTVRESSSVSVKKTAYCDNHAPPESDFLKEGDGTPSPRQKMRQARKLLAEKRSAIPVLSIPTIPSERVTEISQTVSFIRKNQFVKRLMAYWKLKRQSRNGVPLLRRLQASSSLPHPTNRSTSAIADPDKVEESQAYYRYWLRLRQDLERARLLCELVRKREKVKKELIHLKCREVEIQLRPFSIFLLNVLEEIAVKDTLEIFAEPVDTSEVPDYFEVVDKPMDLSTIREKINSFQYNNIDEFESDFNLMIENCLNYNSKETVFYRSAVRLRELGGIIIRHARRSIDAIGYDPTTGLHLPERKYIPVVLTDEEIIQKVDDLLNDESRFEKPFDKHMELLNDALDDTLALSNPATRKKKFNKVKHEQVRVRRLKHSKLNRLSSSSPLKAKYKKTASNDGKDKSFVDTSVSNATGDLSDADEVQSQSRSQNQISRRSRIVRSRLSFSQSTTPKDSVKGKDASTAPATRRTTLRPGKRKRDSSPSPIQPPQTLSPSPSPPLCSPPVLRASTTKLKAAHLADHAVTATTSGRSPPKRSRRVSSATSVDHPVSATSSTTITTTPAKNQTPAKNCKSANLSSSTTSPTSATRLTAGLRDRDRNDVRAVTGIGNRLRDRDSLSSDKSSTLRAATGTITATPSKSPVSAGGKSSATSSPSSTNRRDAILFSKKVNSALLLNESLSQLCTPTKKSNQISKGQTPSPQSQSGSSPSTPSQRNAKTKNVKKSLPNKRLAAWVNNNNSISDNNSKTSSKNKTTAAAVVSVDMEENKESSCSSPPRRNSMRGTRNKKACSNLMNNNNTAIAINNNNVMTLNNSNDSSSPPSWNHSGNNNCSRSRNFYSESANSKNNLVESGGRNLSQTKPAIVSGASPSPWNHHATTTMSSVCLTKVNNSHLVHSNDVNVNIHSSNNVRKKNSKKTAAAAKTNANFISTSNTNISIEITHNVSSTLTPISSSVQHQNQHNIYSNTPSSHYDIEPTSTNFSRVPASVSSSHAAHTNNHNTNNNNNSRHNAKADSFLVYRSGRDMDSNSEEDANDPDNEEKANANSDTSDSDDDGKDSSASASDDSVSISVTSARDDDNSDNEKGTNDNSGSSSSSDSSDSSDNDDDDESCDSSTKNSHSKQTQSNKHKNNSICRRQVGSDSSKVVGIGTDNADADSSSGSGSSSSGSGSGDEETTESSSESDSSVGVSSSRNSNVQISHKNTRGQQQPQRQGQGRPRPRPTTRTRHVMNSNVVNPSVNHSQPPKQTNKTSRKKNERMKVEEDLLLPQMHGKMKGRLMAIAENVEDNDNEDEAEEEEGLVVLDRPLVRVNSLKDRLEPLDLVWAKCKELEGSWYPALIINPDMPLGFTQNDVPIPGPPAEVILKRPRNSHENYFLVLCFDIKKTWEWVSRNHLEPLGQDPKTDQGHLMTRKSDKRSVGALRKSYEKALLHRNRVSGADRNSRVAQGFPN